MNSEIKEVADHYKEELTLLLRQINSLRDLSEDESKPRFSIYQRFATSKDKKLNSSLGCSSE